jgi:hypothetical protein
MFGCGRGPTNLARMEEDPPMPVFVLTHHARAARVKGGTVFAATATSSARRRRPAATRPAAVWRRWQYLRRAGGGHTGVAPVLLAAASG